MTVPLPIPVQQTVDIIGAGVDRLYRAAESATTFDDAMQLCKIARMLEARLGRVADVAIAKAESLIP